MRLKSWLSASDWKILYWDTIHWRRFTGQRLSSQTRQCPMIGMQLMHPNGAIMSHIMDAPWFIHKKRTHAAMAFGEKVLKTNCFYHGSQQSVKWPVTSRCFDGHKLCGSHITNQLVLITHGEHTNHLIRVGCRIRHCVKQSNTKGVPLESWQWVSGMSWKRVLAMHR